MQKLLVEVTATEDNMSIVLSPQYSGISCLAEFMIYSDIVAEVRMLLLATSGEPSCEKSLEAATTIKELMEKVIALRETDDGSFLMLSGGSPDDETERLFNEFDGDNLSSVVAMFIEKLGMDSDDVSVTRVNTKKE